MMVRRPPRAAEWLVERSLPIDTAEREAVLGDLAEEHVEIAQRGGTVAADLWYWRQTIASIVPNLRRRITCATLPREDTATGGLMDSVLQDIRYGWRMMRRRPLTTAVALASLILGISLPAVVFSLPDTAGSISPFANRRDRRSWRGNWCRATISGHSVCGCGSAAPLATPTIDPARRR
jgi:hypothetical protein